MLFQGKLMSLTWENGKKPFFGPQFGYLGLNLGHKFFSLKIWLHRSVDTIFSYHHIQYEKKLSIQYTENLVTDEWMDTQTDGRGWFHEKLSDWRWASKYESIIIHHNMRCFTQFGTICTVFKREKHPWRSVTISKVKDFN